MNAHVFQPTAGSRSACAECGKTRNTKAHKEAVTSTTVAEAREDLLPEVNVQVDDAEVADALEAAGIEVTEDEVNANAEALVNELLDVQVEADEKSEPWGIPPVPDFVPNTPEQQAEVDARRELLDAIDEAADARTNEQVEADDAQAEHDAVDADNKGEYDAEVARLQEERKAPAKRAKVTDVAPIWIGWRIAETLNGDGTLAAKVQAAKPTADKDRTVRLTVAELRELDTVAERFQKEGKTGPEIYSGRALRGRIAAAIAKIEAQA